MATFVRNRLGEVTAVVVGADGAVEAVRVHQPWRPSHVGDVIDGRVVNVAKDARAAFLDIGVARAGFLPLKKTEKPCEGETIRVRVVRDAMADKGAKLKRADSDDLSLNDPVYHQICDLPEPKLFDDPVLAKTYGGAPDEEAVAEVEETLARLADVRVALREGGSLIVEETAALTAIDVNAGSLSPLAANLAGVLEAARQIRLRDLSGLIAIDVIGLDKPGPRGQVLQTLTEALKDDRAEVLGYTRGGVIEVRRSRHGPSLSERLNTPENRALTALMAVLKQARATPAWTPSLALEAPLVAALDGPLAGQRRAAEHKLGRAIAIKRVDFAGPSGYALSHD